MLLPNQKECNKKFADYYNLRNPTSLMYKISILYKYDLFSDHLWDNYRIDCGALGLQIWMHIAIQSNIYIGMSKNLTYTLSVSPTTDTVCGKGMPLRYNNDKQKKPLFSRGLSVCRLLFNSFSKLKIDENYKEKRRLFY